MKRVLQILLFFVFGVHGIALGQSKIAGKISDVKDQVKLSDATVMLLTAKDSIFYSAACAGSNCLSVCLWIPTI